MKNTIKIIVIAIIVILFSGCSMLRGPKINDKLDKTKLIYQEKISMPYAGGVIFWVIDAKIIQKNDTIILLMMNNFGKFNGDTNNGLDALFFQNGHLIKTQKSMIMRRNRLIVEHTFDNDKITPIKTIISRCGKSSFDERKLLKSSQYQLDIGCGAFLTFKSNGNTLIQKALNIKSDFVIDKFLHQYEVSDKFIEKLKTFNIKNFTKLDKNKKK